MKQFRKILVSLALLFSVDSYAISIDLITNKSAVNIGDSIEVAVRVSGLNDASAPSLGAYDVNFLFDNSLFNFDSISWGDPVKGKQMDASGFGSLQDFTSGTGWLNVLEISFDDALDLELLQAGEFTLFSVLLNAVAIGSGNFSLTVNALGDAYGDEVVVDTINGAQITAGSVSVPEPSSLLLLLGMLAVVALRTKVPQSQR